MGGDGFIGELILNRGDDILPIMYCLSPDTLVNWYFVAILKLAVRMYYHQALFLSHLDMDLLCKGFYASVPVKNTNSL